MATVAGLFNTRIEAQDAIEQLRQNGIDVNNISVAMQDRTETRAIAEETGTHAGAAGGAVAGGIFGGVLGVVLGAGLIAIPGIGPILAAGPIAGGVAGLLAGGATGGIVGALTDAGVPHEEAQVYSTGLQRGGVLVTANVDGDQAALARQVMDGAGALDTDATAERFRSDTDYRLGDENADVRRRRDSGVSEAVSGGASAVIGGVAGAVLGGPLGAAAGAAIGAAAGAGGAHIAQNTDETSAGTMSGGAGGALAGGTLGALVGGPVGAAIGAGIGAAGGAALGDNATDADKGAGVTTGGVAGGTAGGVIGGAVGGPIGAVAGAAIGSLAGAGSTGAGEAVSTATDQTIDDAAPVRTDARERMGREDTGYTVADRAGDAVRGTAANIGNIADETVSRADNAINERSPSRAVDQPGYTSVDYQTGTTTADGTPGVRSDGQSYDAETFRDQTRSTSGATPVAANLSNDTNYNPDETLPLPERNTGNAQDINAQRGTGYQASGSGISTDAGQGATNQPFSESETARKFEHMNDDDPPPAGQERDYPQRY